LIGTEALTSAATVKHTTCAAMAGGMEPIATIRPQTGIELATAGRNQPMQTDQITELLDAANIRYTPEAVAMLAECNAPATDFEQYREAHQVYWACDPSHPSLEVRCIIALIAAHPHMPETKAMQARIAELEARAVEVSSAHKWMADLANYGKVITLDGEWVSLEDFYNKPAPDGWIEWHGGECPVDGDVFVVVRYRTDPASMDFVKFRTFRASGLVWDQLKAASATDIIAYRVLP